jgi:hypothetical protein
MPQFLAVISPSTLDGNNGFPILGENMGGYGGLRVSSAGRVAGIQSGGRS